MSAPSIIDRYFVVDNEGDKIADGPYLTLQAAIDAGKEEMSSRLREGDLVLDPYVIVRPVAEIRPLACPVTVIELPNVGGSR